MNKRINWVDAVKGFAMISIILGHFCAFFMNYLPVANIMFIFIGSFQVPLFFLMSGYTMSSNKWMGWSGIKKLAKRCFLPYIFGGICSIIMCLIFIDPNKLYEFAFGFFYGAGAYRDHILFGDTSIVNAIGLIWFLPALFFGKIIASAMYKLPMIAKISIAGILFLVAGYTAPILFLPFDIQQGMCASWYIVLGMWLKHCKMFEKNTAYDMKFIGGCFAIVGGLYIAAAELGMIWIPMYCNSTYNQPVLDLCCTFFTCVLIIFCVRFIVEKIYVLDRVFTWCGIYSMGIFIFHAITLSPGDEVKWWCYKLVDAGNDPALMFFVLLGINLLLVGGMTAASKYIPPLRYILYGKKAPVMPEKN